MELIFQQKKTIARWWTFQSRSKVFQFVNRSYREVNTKHGTRFSKEKGTFARLWNISTKKHSFL